MDGNCDQFYHQLSAYFDGELAESEARLLKAHLDSCADCTSTLASYDTIRRGLIAMSARTGTKRILAADILAALDRDDDALPC